MEQKIAVKQCPVFELYNFIQDLRHLIVIDLRQNIDGNQKSIRGSFNFKKDQLKEYIKYLEESTKKTEVQEKKYEQKPIRRAVFYVDGEINSEIESELKVPKLVEILKQLDSTYRIYYLKEGYSKFEQKYPFLCLSQEQLTHFNDMKDLKVEEVKGNNQKRSELLTEVQKQVLFAHSQFPSEIYENQVYLGNIHHANSDNYLEALKIKTILDFTHEHTPEFQKVVDEKLKKKYKYEHIPLEKDKMGVELDYNEVNEFILTQIEEEGNGPVLMFCKDGHAISPNFAIAYLMYQKNMQFQIASLKIFQYKGGVMNTCKNCYNQLMSYVPKQ